MNPPTSRETPLLAEHEALGAAFTDFGGWSMPVRYSSDLAEHRAVRTAAGLFDISHMSQFRVAGADAGAYLDHALSGRLSAVPPGRAKYTLLLDPAGGIVDDLVVYRPGETEYLVVANATRRDAVSAALAERATGFTAVVADVSDEYALVALQGPRSQEVLSQVAQLSHLRTPVADLGYFAVTEASFAGEPALIARTGYTGEDGFEVFVPPEQAPALWRDLLAAGTPHGLVPAGLAARDTLRLEAGMPLYGHELSREIRPSQVGLDRVVASDKRVFVGKGAMAPAPGAPVLVGLTAEGRRAARSGYAVLSGDEPVGEVTSGALSPTLGYPIAMAFVDPAVSAPGTVLTLDVRGTRIPATVVALPFYRRKS